MGEVYQCSVLDCAYQTYERGRIYFSNEYGAVFLLGDIYNTWFGSGVGPFGKDSGMEGNVGRPMTDERSTPDGRGRFVHFEWDTSIYWTPEHGSKYVMHAIRELWASQGWELGEAGYPVENERLDPRCTGMDGQVGYMQRFERGIICKHRSGARPWFVKW